MNRYYYIDTLDNALDLHSKCAVIVVVNLEHLIQVNMLKQFILQAEFIL